MIQLARRAVRGLSVLVSRPGPGVVVLTYHLVGAGTRSPVDLVPEAFREQIAALRDSRRVVSLDVATGLLASGALPRRSLVVLTFDDAYANFHDVAWPVLQEAALPATLYVPCDFVNRRGPSPIRGVDLPPCSWAQLRDMVADGLSIGSHTLSHPDLRRCSPARLCAEIQDSRFVLEDRLGTVVNSFCYPRGLWSSAAERLVASSYVSAVVSGGRRAAPGRWSPHRLERVPLKADLLRIQPVLESDVWLEERLAAVVRAWRS